MNDAYPSDAAFLTTASAVDLGIAYANVELMDDDLRKEEAPSVDGCLRFLKEAAAEYGDIAAEHLYPFASIVGALEAAEMGDRLLWLEVMRDSARDELGGA